MKKRYSNNKKYTKIGSHGIWDIYQYRAEFNNSGEINTGIIVANEKLDRSYKLDNNCRRAGYALEDGIKFAKRL